MANTTQIVTLPEEHLDDLRQWLAAREGSTKGWNLVLGTFGHLYPDGDQPSLNAELKMIVALTRPHMRPIDLSSMKAGTRDELFQIAADSYEWMNEGYLDGIEEAEILRILEDALDSRGPVNIPDAKAKVQHLSNRTALQELPDWEDMTKAQQAIVDEAFRMDSRWQRDGAIEDGPAQLAQRYLMRTL